MAKLLRSITVLLIFIPTICSSGFASDIAASNNLQKIEVRGVELHYQMQGKGPTVVFVHGGLVDYREFQPVAAGLSGKYQTVVYSRRYNFPNKNDVILKDFSAVTEAEDLAAFIRTLKLKDVTVVGASYGAYTALMLTLHHPDLVSRLVLVEPPLMGWLKDIPAGPAVYEDFVRRLWEPVRTAFDQDRSDAAIKHVLEFFVGVDGATQVPEEVVEMIRANLKEWKVLLRSTNTFPPVTREEVRKIEEPVLMLSGGNSYAIGKLLDPEIEKQLPNVRRVVIPKGTHDVCVELPESCSAEILKFLQARH
jgi:non-heme chloroperoxidase